MSAEQEAEIDALRWALAEIADLTQRQQLPITAEVHALATEALYGPRDSDATRRAETACRARMRRARPIRRRQGSRGSSRTMEHPPMTTPPPNRQDTGALEPEPRGFVEWDYEPDEFDRDVDDDDDWSDCSMGPDGYCGQAGSEYCEFECSFRRRYRP